MSTRRILPASRDHIRIVPLNLPKELRAVHAAPPHLDDNGGPLLPNVEVFTVFWGNAWTAAQLAVVGQVNSFFDFILASPLIDQLAEYGRPPGTPIGHGSRTGSITITTPHLGRSVSDNAIQHMLQQEISSNNAFPQPGPNTLYFVYVQPGVSVIAGGSRSCQSFCGYHDAIHNQIFYAVMPYPGCTGCTGTLASFDALTSTSSHELCEAITDPVPGASWYDQNNGEIGDICAWETKKVGDYTVQLEWSNHQGKCI